MPYFFSKYEATRRCKWLKSSYGAPASSPNGQRRNYTIPQIQPFLSDKLHFGAMLVWNHSVAVDYIKHQHHRSQLTTRLSVGCPNTSKTKGQELTQIFRLHDVAPGSMKQWGCTNKGTKWIKWWRRTPRKTNDDDEEMGYEEKRVRMKKQVQDLERRKNSVCRIKRHARPYKNHMLKDLSSLFNKQTPKKGNWHL